MAEHRSVIGMYEDRSTAEIVANELNASGFTSRHVEIMDGTDRAAGSNGKLKERLMSWGLPDQDAGHYADEVNAGRSLVVVDAKDDQVSEAVRILRHETTGAERGRAEGELDASETVRVPVIEEELHVGKERIHTGGVRIVRRTTERPVQAEVQLREEHIEVERHATDRPVTSADLDQLREGKLELSESEERPVVSKSAHVVEEVEIGKRTSEHTEHIEETVHREDIEVEKLRGKEPPEARP